MHFFGTQSPYFKMWTKNKISLLTALQGWTRLPSNFVGKLHTCIQWDYVVGAYFYYDLVNIHVSRTFYDFIVPDLHVFVYIQCIMILIIFCDIYHYVWLVLDLLFRSYYIQILKFLPIIYVQLSEIRILISRHWKLL